MCLDQLKFFGKPDDANKHQEFGHCKFPKTWAESQTTYKEGSHNYPYYENDNAVVRCILEKGNHLESVNYKLCDNGSNPDSNADFFEIFKKGDGDNCTVSLKNGTHLRNNFVKVNDTNACGDMTFSPEMDLWLINASTGSSGNLCLTHFFLETYHSDRLGKYFLSLPQGTWI